MFEKSGQSVSEFCRLNDLSAATLSLWRQQQAGTG
jgi:transposase-like protein